MMYGCRVKHITRVAPSDSTNNEGIDFLSAQGHNRVTGAMNMVAVPVVHPLNLIFLRVDHDKNRGRTKVVVNLAFNPLVFQNRKTYFHTLSPLLFILLIAEN
jgi:hypothetical protein